MPRAKFLIGGGAVVAVLVGLMLWAMTRPGAAAFYMTTTEVSAIERAEITRDVRVNGKVVPGSIVTEGIATHFVISDGETPLEIRTEAPLPDTFRANSEVVALGRPVDGAGDEVEFVASEVLAKCPSKFKTAA
ncbi:MAG: cytochrome c maturation protein CcmE [Actinomycetota bacterium]